MHITKWSLGIVLLFGCRSANQSHFAPAEFMDIKFSESNFKYIYYRMVDANDFTYQYCEGTYKKTGDKTYELTPNHFDKSRCEATVEETIDNSLGKKIRFKAESKVYGDFEKKFKMVAHLDSTSLFAYGPKLDTLIEVSSPSQIYVEIFSPSQIGSPVPFYSIRTKSLATRDSRSNSFFIKIPLEYNSFYYVNLEPMTVKDLGKEYLLEKTGQRVKKEHWLQ